MANSPRLAVAEDLILLERGQDELLLANALVRRPLYMKKGGKYIRTFLDAVRELGSRDGILRAYPREAGLLNVMLDYGIVFPDGLQDQFKPMAPAGPVPAKKMNMALYLLLSQSCNMNCAYCLDGRNSYQTDQGLKMKAETAFQAIDRCLDDLAEGGNLQIEFFGGEPLLNWPLAKEAILHCGKSLGEKHPGKSAKYCVTSNLSFLPQDLVEWAKKYDISFMCDIDGPPAVHDRCRPFRNGGGTYEASARSIRELRAAGLRVELRATVTSLNQDFLGETSALHKALGGSTSAFVPVIPVNSDESILPESLLPDPEKVIRALAEIFRSGPWKTGELYPFNQYLSRFKPGFVTVVGCGAAYGNKPVVSANGDVYPCVYLVGIKRFQMGGAGGSEKVLEVLQEELNVDRLEKCAKCPWRYLCGGGCPVGRLTVDRNPNASPAVKVYWEKIRCDYTQSVLELLLWRKAEESATAGPVEPDRVSQCL